MKPFKFKLDPVLRYRAYKMRIELMKLARAQKELLDAQEAIRRINERKRNAGVTLSAEQDRGMDGRKYHLHRAYLDGLDKELVDAEAKRLELAGHVSERQGVVKAERVKKETLAHLKDQKKQAHIRSVDRMEQKEADELVGLRFRNGVLL